MCARKLFEWFDKKGHLRCKMDKNGFGCLFYAQKLLKDMKKDNWFDLKSESIKKSFDKVGSLKKGTEIGPDCYVSYGIATFY